MPFVAPHIAWHGIAPELALVGGALVALLIDAVKPAVDRRFLAGLSLATIGLAAWFTFDLRDTRAVIMQGTLAVDGVALFGRLILLITAAMTILISYHYLSRRRIHRGEYYPLLLLATSGMTLLAASNDLLLSFLAIETLSLALYVMVGFARRDEKSQEGALKYFLLGAFSSAFLLYGIALTYGATGSTQLSVISKQAAVASVDERLMFVAVAMIAVGFAFKVAAVPFHMWSPDAYQGAPTSVTGFMAAGTKAAAFIGFFRVFLVAFGALQWDWRPVLWIVAVATMAVGSLLAIAQTDVKRMLAYSSIAHAGYVLIGLVAANRDGVSAALFYLLIYAVMVLGAFAAVIVSAPGGSERLSLAEWGGIGRRYPVFGGAMTLFLLALAGLPPTSGFTGKFLLFAAAIKAHENALVVAATITSVVAAFFYVRLIVLIWLQDPPPDDGHPGIGPTPALITSLGIAAAATIVFGVWPQSLIDLARNAISHGFVG
ncbi:MAG: NADH-quinone oxidoreductase subunit NuoN [Actinomycetota bacterium]|nr:NADH-quinone oxidoreductase subunit NuoN [Actinomycetota bacterium]